MASLTVRSTSEIAHCSEQLLCVSAYCFPGWRFHSLSGWPAPAHHHPHSENIFFASNRSFPWSSLRSLFPVLFLSFSTLSLALSSLQLLLRLLKIAIRSLHSLLPANELNSHRFFSYVTWFRTPTGLMNLCWTHSILSLFFFYWGAQKEIHYSIFFRGLSWKTPIWLQTAGKLPCISSIQRLIYYLLVRFINKTKLIDGVS